MTDLYGFCDSPLWVQNLTWNTTSPDFTSCFFNTVLVWIPCGFLWLLSPLEFWKISSSQSCQNSWTFCSMGKTLLNIFLALLAMVDIIEITQNVNSGLTIVGAELSAPIIEFFSFCLVLILTLYARNKGLGTSLLLFGFWTLEALATILQLYSAILQIDHSSDKIDSILITSLSGKSLLVLMQLILSLLSEKTVNTKNACPVKNVSPLSYITFFWIRSILIKGYHNQLHINSLLPLCPDLHSEYISKVFNKVFCRKITLRKPKITLINEEEENECLIEEENVPEPLEYQYAKQSLFRALFRICIKPFCIGAVTNILYVFSSFLSPYFLNLLLDFIESQDFLWHGILYAISYYLSLVISQLFEIHYEYMMEIAAIQVKSALTSAIYNKIFHLSPDARKEYSAGDIINMMSVDVTELFEFTIYFIQLWAVPITVAIGIYFLWQFLGISTLAGLIVLIFLAPITVLLAKFCDTLQQKQMELKDDRIRIMNEILNGIKILKLYAWEIPFMKKVTDVRKKEISFLRKYYYIDSVFSCLWSLGPNLILIACFATFVLSDKTHILDTKTVFVSLNLFNILRLPMGLLPDLLSRLIKALVSLRRLEKFLNTDELKCSVTHHINQNDAIKFSFASFTWNLNEKIILKNIHLNIEKGSLIAIVGQVGSGKSSLLSAILDEMYKVEGSINVMGSIAYVPQTAWIQNATIRDNILFTEEWNESDYNLVLEFCALLPDLEILPAGDLTEIGEKGINLSGGQKQRVSLARAVYQNADIYLLDDPLSAVDASVGRYLFEEVIGRNGILATKTRLLVTHNISVLPEVDYIIVLDDGMIIEQGSYQQLLETNGKFSKLMEQEYSVSHTDEKKNDNLIVIDSENKDLNKTKIKTGGQLIEEELMEIGKVQWSIYKLYFRKLGYFYCFLLIFGFIGEVSFEIGTGLWLSSWSMDKLLPNGQQNISQRNLRLKVFALLLLGEGIFSLATNIFMFKRTTNAAVNIHYDLLNRILKAPLSFFDITPIGRIINRFSKDIDSVDAEIPSNFYFSLLIFFLFLSTIVVMEISSKILIVSFIPLILIYYALLKFYITTSRQLSRLESITRSPVYDNFSESIDGVSSIRSYRAVDYFIRRSNKRLDINNNCYFTGMTLSRWLQAILLLTGGSIALFTALLAVFGRDFLNPGLIGLALTYSTDVPSDLGWLVRLISQLETSMVSLERISEYSNIEQETFWEESKIPVSDDWPEEGAISMCDFSTSYRTGLNPVLSDINLDIGDGEKVGIVGRTGAGKSSLILSIFRIIEPINGCILINNLDISQIGLQKLRSKLTVIPQDPVIFGGSVRMNLDPWEEHNDDNLWLALEHSHLKNFVSSLSEGLEYELLEGGSNISAGQRQLLCLARALLRKTRILLLDEATASIDLETDQLVHNTIHNVFSHCTIVTIAHRLHTVMECDRIIVLSNGCIVEDGPPQRLLRDTSSYFYSMAKDAGIT